ncbi:MAG: FtsX-like permease family protein, partial [Gemmatimonas sp.]|nr:FtsX-like permease family protein [Gemmatimonas sp.]
MDRLIGAWARARALLLRRSAEREMDEELQHHLQMEAEYHRRRGISAGEARRRAVLSFGGVEKHREALRDGIRLAWLEDLVHDARYAVRTLWRSPGFTLAAVATLAVGIGSATSLFSVLNSVLLRELPIEGQTEVVLIRKPVPAGPVDHGPIRGREFAAFEQRTAVLEGVAGSSFLGTTEQVLRDAGEPLTAAGTWVTGDFLPLLGVRPVIGRILSPDDDRAGAEPVMVIGYGFWRRYFGGSPAALGHGFEREGKRFTVVGVLPAGFEYPSGAEFWIPLSAATSRPGSAIYDVLGRLREGADLEDARDDYANFLREEYGALPPGSEGSESFATPLVQEITGDVRPILWVAAVAVALLLLIACVNVANLLLIRGSSRSHEIAIRGALGGGRSRLIRQLLTEGSLLTFLGGVGGLLLATIGVTILASMAPAELPQRALIGINADVLLIGVGVTTVAALVSALLPAIVSGTANLELWLRRGGPAVSANRTTRNLRNTLAIGQIACAVLVLAGAGLVVRSLFALQAVDLGFEEEGLAILETTHPLSDEALERVRSIPGVEGATALFERPFEELSSTLIYTAEGQSAEEQGANSWVNYEVVDPEYFPTLNVRIRTGRPFNDQDRQDALAVAIASEVVARQTWPGEDPVGKRIKRGGVGADTEWLTVVGVADDTRYRDLVTAQPTIYVPVQQTNASGEVLGVRTQRDPADLAPLIDSILRQLDPDWAIVGGGSVQQLLAAPLARPLFTSKLMGTFAMITLLLAAVGIFGVGAAVVRQRTREIGIRMAVGATRGEVRKLVLKQGVRIALSGCAVGLVAALFTTRIFQALLFQVSPTDPATLAAAMGVVLGIAWAASYLPARRASRLDPIKILRVD